MQRLCYVAIAILLPGCAAATPAPQPPSVVVPVPPATPDPGAAPTVTPAPAQAPGACDAWTEEVTRHEKLARVATCQIGPVDLSTDLQVEARVLAREGAAPARLSLRIARDVEQAQGTPAPASLAGKSYVAEQTAQGITVQDAGGTPVPDDEAKRVRALAAAVLGWPGAPPDPAKLQDAVRAVLDAHLHGVPATDVKTTVRPAGARREAWGDALAFEVTVHASESDAGMCHHWTNDAELTGELLLRAADGALVHLHLSGPTSDTEAVCQGNTAPRTCNKGEITLDVSRTCAASP